MTSSQRLPDMEESLAQVMMRVRRSVRLALRQAGAQEGLSQNEIEVLLLLYVGRWDTARDISRARGLPRSLVSKSVDQLLKRGYIETRQDPQDRRVARLRLLPPAQAAVERLNQAKGVFFSRLCQGITPEEAAAFRSLVDKMMQNLDGLLPEGEPEG
ncbi:MAG TPA: MarR family transcriptional regulator [Candidatus Acutalibacter pullicola]|uniref:MarR family transcriptional regulator n=1 Tax=Candidatus Acutalibacter pullicola TaxID=2838417 RepID=A0A9D2MXC5_9FIRM|nr:MarR family transcriptional regulator [Candidatus Acutalibacter pullicola]